jgi:hypothetical protein
MEVWHVEQFRLPVLEPLGAGKTLALRTVVIPTRNGEFPLRVLWAKIVMGSQRRFLAEFCLFFKAMMLLCVVNFPHNSGPQRRYG